MEIAGTMRAYLRQRPNRENENENNEAKTEVPSKAALSNLYEYDRVFNEYSSQNYIFRCALKRTILYAVDGYNVTTIAYGHNGTGKTHTIFGGPDITKPEDAGMIPKSVAHILEVLEEEQLEHTITVSYLDIYNERLYDLLSAIDDDTELIINEDMDEKDSVVIQGLSEVIVNNMPELYRILQIGVEKRDKSCSFENSLSSQRHSLFYVTVYTKEESVSGQTILKRGKLMFVDVAASDCSAQSDQISVQSPEDINTIHQSLNTFNECMIKLASGSTDIPYGESKLTQLLQDSLGGYTKTILLGTVDCSSLNFTGNLVYLAKKITTKPWIRHVFKIYDILEKYKIEIDKFNFEIKDICTTSLFPITDDTNFIIKEFEEKQTMIYNKVQAVKFLNERKNRWLEVYQNFNNTEVEEVITTIDKNKNFRNNEVLTKCLACDDHFEITEQHLLNVKIQAAIINDLQHKLQKQKQDFHKNLDQPFDRIYSQMAQLKDKADLLQRFQNSRKACISKTIEVRDEKWTDLSSFITKSTKIVNDSIDNCDAIVTMLSKFTDISHFTKDLRKFVSTSLDLVSSSIKDGTDQKHYVTVMANNISSCISEITSTGRHYIETARELCTKSKNTLTETMDLQKKQKLDFEEKYKNAIDGLKIMKSASDKYFQTANEQSKICKSNLTARRASLTDARNMINAWQRQTVVKVNAFAENIAKNRETHNRKLHDANRQIVQTGDSLKKNRQSYKTMTENVDVHMVEIIHRVENNIYCQEERIRWLIGLYLKDVITTLKESAICAVHKNVLEEKESKELENSVNEYILKTQNLYNDKKRKFTYLINKLDLALEQCKLTKFSFNNIILSEIPSHTEQKELLQEEYSENTSVALLGPLSWKMKCKKPQCEGTLQERCKMRKKTSRRRREFEAAKAHKESN